MVFPLSDHEHVAIRRRIEEQPELVVAAAIRWGKVVVMAERPGRHADCIWPLHSIGADYREQGFVTNRGRFVDRAEAGRIVLASGQGAPGGTPTSNPNMHLFSEDMWNDTDTEVADRSRETPK